MLLAIEVQRKLAQTLQQHVSYEIIWIRRTCDYILLNVHYCVQFSGRVRVRIIISVWLVSCYAHVFVRLKVVSIADRMLSSRPPPPK